MPELTVPLHVLLIEASADDALLILQALRRAGYAADVTRVETAEAMQRALAEAAWDVVLADYSLPRFSALAALDCLHQSGLDLPFLIVSGTLPEAEAVTALRTGAHDFITKAHLARLGPAVARELREAENRRQARRAQALLDDQQASFQLLFENNPLPMWVYDAHTLAFLEVNHSAIVHYGYSREEFLALTITDIRPPEDIPALLREVSQVRPDFRQSDQIWRHCLKNGQVIEVEISSHALRFGERDAVLVVAHNVTERHRAEAALAASEKRFRALIEKSADGVALIDAQGVVLYTSPATAHILGYTPEYWVGGDIRNRAHPDEAAQFTAWFSAVTADPGASVTAELRYRRADDTWCWLEATATNLLAEPSVGAIVVNYRDVTERKRAQAALEASEAELRALFAAMNDVIFVLNSEGRFLKVAPTNPQFLLFPPDQVVGKTAQALLDPASAAELLGHIQAALDQRAPVHYEYALPLHGQSLWFLATVSPLGPDTVFFVARDITERKQAEAALAASERRFRVLIENSADAITLINPEGAVVYDSPAAPRLLGYEPQEWIGRSAFELVHPGDLPHVQQLLQQLVQSPDRPVEAHFRVQHKSGTWRWLEAVAANLLADPSVNAVVVNYRDITARREAEEKIRRQVQYLAALREIDRAISASFDLRLSLNLLLAQVTERLGVDAAAVLVFNQGTQMLEPAVMRGFRDKFVEPIRLRIGEGYAGQAALERRLIHIPDLRARQDNPRLARFVESEGLAGYYAVPLVARGQVRGVLEVFQRPGVDDVEAEWLDFLSTLAEQAAIAIDNATLLDGLQRSNLDLGLAYDATIEGWSRALDLRDKETEGHTQRVTELTLQLSMAAGIHEAELVHVRRGALLHDIGKMGIPDRILLKPGPLTDDEWVIMRQHPTMAYELLSPIAYLRPALDIPYCHHEKWDGTGYPRGLKGEQIPLSARLFAVVDVWDALRSDRPYRPAWPEATVLAHIRGLAGTHFDPAAVEVFLHMVE